MPASCVKVAVPRRTGGRHKDHHIFRVISVRGTYGASFPFAQGCGLDSGRFTSGGREMRSISMAIALAGLSLLAAGCTVNNTPPDRTPTTVVTQPAPSA